MYMYYPRWIIHGQILNINYAEGALFKGGPHPPVKSGDYPPRVVPDVVTLDWLVRFQKF